MTIIPAPTPLTAPVRPPPALAEVADTEPVAGELAQSTPVAGAVRVSTAQKDSPTVERLRALLTPEALQDPQLFARLLQQPDKLAEIAALLLADDGLEDLSRLIAARLVESAREAVFKELQAMLSQLLSTTEREAPEIIDLFHRHSARMDGDPHRYRALLEGGEPPLQGGDLSEGEPLSPEAKRVLERGVRDLLRVISAPNEGAPEEVFRTLTQSKLLPQVAAIIEKLAEARDEIRSLSKLLAPLLRDESARSNLTQLVREQWQPRDAARLSDLITIATELERRDLTGSGGGAGEIIAGLNRTVEGEGALGTLKGSPQDLKLPAAELKALVSIIKLLSADGALNLTPVERRFVQFASMATTLSETHEGVTPPALRTPTPQTVAALREEFARAEQRAVLTTTGAPPLSRASAETAVPRVSVEGGSNSPSPTSPSPRPHSGAVVPIALPGFVTQLQMQALPRAPREEGGERGDPKRKRREKRRFFQRYKLSLALPIIGPLEVLIASHPSELIAHCIVDSVEQKLQLEHRLDLLHQALQTSSYDRINFSITVRADASVG